MAVPARRLVQLFADGPWGDGLRRVRSASDRILAEGVLRADAARCRLSSPAGGAIVSPVNADVQVDVILPAAAGSFGDEGLARGTAWGLRAVDRVPHLWVPDENDHELYAGRGGSETLHAMTRLRRGTTPLLPQPARQQWGTRPLTVIGADTIRGDYLHGYLSYRVRALQVAASRGMPTQLVHFSFSDSLTQTAVSLLRSLPEQAQLWARDELSRQRAQDVLGRSVKSAPDVAALMAPQISPDTEGFLTQFSSAPVSLVPNAHFMTMGWQSKETVVDSWLRVAEDVHARGLPLALVPHDVRKRPGDVDLARTISQALGERGIESAVFEAGSAPLAKRVLSQSAAVVSARMHGCVAAMSSGVPTVGIEYLGKFQGQFAWSDDLGAVVSLNKSALAGARLIELIDGSPARTSAKGVDVEAVGWLRTFSV